MGDIARSLSAIQSKIQTCASGRNVRLVAVSKTKPVEDLMEAYNAGQRHFGENYVRLFRINKSRESISTDKPR